MENMIVVVFDDEPKALEGLRRLRQLDTVGEVWIYEVQVVAKESSGAIRIVTAVDDRSISLIGGGTVLGALIGLLGGPVGVVVGGAAGALIGGIGDIEESGVTAEFVRDVEKVLTPGKVALAADIDEDWVTSLDTRMEEIGGVMFRQTRALAETTQDDRDAAAHRADMEQLQAERAQARADRLAKIDAKIDSLRAKLEAAIERKRVRMQLRQRQREAKIQALRAKAEQAEGEIRRRQEARIAALRDEYEEKARG
jgi:uncharacterized membrane protein